MLLFDGVWCSRSENEDKQCPIRLARGGCRWGSWGENRRGRVVYPLPRLCTHRSFACSARSAQNPALQRIRDTPTSRLSVRDIGSTDTAPQKPFTEHSSKLPTDACEVGSVKKSIRCTAPFRASSSKIVRIEYIEDCGTTVPSTENRNRAFPLITGT